MIDSDENDVNVIIVVDVVDAGNVGFGMGCLEGWAKAMVSDMVRV